MEKIAGFIYFACAANLGGARRLLLPSLFVYSSAAPRRSGKFFVVSPSNEKLWIRGEPFPAFCSYFPSGISAHFFPLFTFIASFRHSELYYYCYNYLSPISLWRFPLFTKSSKNQCLLWAPDFLRGRNWEEGRNKSSQREVVRRKRQRHSKGN